VKLVSFPSKAKHISCGVPPGPMLRPLLLILLIYINDLRMLVDDSDLEITRHTVFLIYKIDLKMN